MFFRLFVLCFATCIQKVSAKATRSSSLACSSENNTPYKFSRAPKAVSMTNHVSFLPYLQAISRDTKSGNHLPEIGIFYEPLWPTVKLKKSPADFHSPFPEITPNTFGNTISGFQIMPEIKRISLPPGNSFSQTSKPPPPHISGEFQDFLRKPLPNLLPASI